MAELSVTNLARRQKAPRFPYAKIAAKALPGWDISLAFVDAAKARALNDKLRGKSYVPNVLSYAAGAKNGEIIICLAEAARQAPEHGLTTRQFVLYLFIHGLMHLKGRVHGATMERSERNLMAEFATGAARDYPHVTTHSHGHRHRHLPGEAGRGRRGRG